VLKNVLRVGAAGSGIATPSLASATRAALRCLSINVDFSESTTQAAAQMRAMVLPPTCPEFMHPGIGKPAMQNPSFFGGLFHLK